MNLNDAVIFVRCVEHGGFAAASRALGIAKSTLSKRLGELEAELGVRLVNRTSRSFTVTEAGRDFLRHAGAMLLEAEAAEAVIRGRLAEPSGTVRITASVPTTQSMLAKLLPSVASALPKVRIVLHATDRFVDVVQEGFDIVVRSHFAPLPDSGLVQRKLSEQAVILVASPDYLTARGNPVEPGDLEGHDGVMSTLGSPASWVLRNAEGREVTVVPCARLHADESVVILEAAATGLGIATLPVGIVRDFVADGRLVQVMPRWSAGSVTTTLLMPSRRGQLPSVRAVVDAMVKGLAAENDLPS